MNALFNYCFPKNCVAVNFCDKWNSIPKHYENTIEDLNKTHHCRYKEAYHNYLDSDAWSVIRSIVLMKAGFKCEKCGEKEHLHIHHLNYSTVFNESLKDLVLLCRECHKEQHEK